jgi:hypothetical protein
VLRCNEKGDNIKVLEMKIFNLVFEGFLMGALPMLILWLIFYGTFYNFLSGGMTNFSLEMILQTRLTATISLGCGVIAGTIWYSKSKNENF